MRKTQENRFTMIKTVRTFLEQNQETVNNISELANSQVQLNTIYSDLKIKDNEKKNSLKGKAATKLALSERLIKSSLSVSAALFAFAKKNKNVELMEKTDINVTSLERMRDTMLVEAMEGLKSLASAYISELASYGITQEKLNDFSAKIEEYDDSIGDKETGMVKRKGAVKSLKLLFSEADEVFLVMDKLVNGMEEDDKQVFVRGYNDSRKIQNLGVRHRKEELKKSGTPGEEITTIS